MALPCRPRIAMFGRMTMTNGLPSSLSDLADSQRGVITRSQALSAGMSKDLIASRLDGGRWQRLHTGVYAVFSGPVDREAKLWAAVLRAGEGAALSHETAAELDRLTDRPSSTIHVTIPSSRRVMPIRGVVLHARLDAEVATHPSRLPPRLRIEETALDLADQCGDAWNAVGWISSALGRRLTTQDRLRETMSKRSRIRWRNDLAVLLSPDLAGVHSVLEFRYVRDVERRHGLPKGKRQVRVVQNATTAYRDVLYEEFALIVELDGRAAHPGDTRWQDIWRDNAAAADGASTLRYGYRELTARACLVASQVSEALTCRGWQGSARQCSVACAVRRPTS
jgi:very-short-patch-repair endonuclease